MLLLLELDSVSSSGISCNVDSFGSDLVAASVRGIFVFGGSVSELPVVCLLSFFGL